MKKYSKQVCASQPPPQKKKKKLCLEPNALSCFHCSDTTGEVHGDHPKGFTEKAIKYNKHEDWKKRIANQNWVI